MASGRAVRGARANGAPAVEDRQTQLIEIASRLFAAHGYAGTSLRDIAEEARITKAALYYYVTNKQEILFECHMMSLDFGDEAMKYSEEHGKTGLEKILLLIDKYVKTITSEMGSFAVLGEYDALESQNKAIIGKRRDKFDRGFRKLISEGIADGTVRAVDPKLTVFFFMGSINWMTRWFTTEGPLTGEQVARQLVDLVEGALRSR